MEYLLDRQGEKRLGAYLNRIGVAFKTEPQRRSFAVYATGLMGDGERKSAEPMAARACPDPELVDAAHQRLAYFTRGADWPDRDVRRAAARYALGAMTAREPVLARLPHARRRKSAVTGRFPCGFAGATLGIQK